MITFKLRNYATLERSINNALTALNSTPVATVLAPYIDNIPAVEIRPTAILQQQKEDKANALPGAKEFRKAGVDLTLTMPECTVSASQLNAITATATTYNNSILDHASRFISYNQKANQWVVNPAGNKALADAITTLDVAQEKTYTQAVALFEHVVKTSPELLPVLFPEGKQGPRGEDLNHEWLVNKIRVYSPKK